MRAQTHDRRRSYHCLEKLKEMKNAFAVWHLTIDCSSKPKKSTLALEKRLQNSAIIYSGKTGSQSAGSREARAV